MDGNTKRIVVIKGIASNIIEEAILILRSEPDPGAGKKHRSIADKSLRKKDNDFLLKEAEMIINNYIKESKNKGIYSDTDAKRPGLWKNKGRVNLIINLALGGSITFLIFVLLKLL